MTEFDRKVDDASTRLNRTVSNIAATVEKETAELVTYLNDEVVPAVRTHSSNALRLAAGKLSRFAEFLETQQEETRQKQPRQKKDTPPEKEAQNKEP